MLLTVEVPDGVHPLDAMIVTGPDGREYEVQVPKGCFPGSSIEVDLPCSEANGTMSNQIARELQVTVPDGVEEGQLFTVEITGGEAFEICCPDGCAGGSTIWVEVPESFDADQQHPQRPASPPTTAPHGNRRTLRASREARTSSEALSTSGYSENWHRYKPGQLVQVLRTAGFYSRGTVVCSYEGVFDVLYQVQLESGHMKQAVPEGEMFAADDADDQNFGQHFMSLMQQMMDADMLDEMLCDRCTLSPCYDDDY